MSRFIFRRKFIFEKRSDVRFPYRFPAGRRPVGHTPSKNFFCSALAGLATDGPINPFSIVYIQSPALARPSGRALAKRVFFTYPSYIQNLPCLHPMPTSHAYIPWRHPMATSHGDIPWRHPMATFHAYIPWRHPMATSHGDIPWRHSMPTSHAYIPWRHPMPISHADIPCLHPMPTSHVENKMGLSYRTRNKKTQ